MNMHKMFTLVIATYLRNSRVIPLRGNVQRVINLLSVGLPILGHSRIRRDKQNSIKYTLTPPPFLWTNIDKQEDQIHGQINQNYHF